MELRERWLRKDRVQIEDLDLDIVLLHTNALGLPIGTTIHILWY